MQTKHDAALLINENLALAMSFYSKASPLGHVRQYPNVQVVSSGLDLPFFNSAILTSDIVSQQEQTLQQCHFQEKRVPWSFWVCPELAGETKSFAAAARQHGLKKVTGPAGMMLNQVVSPSRLLPDLRVKPIDSASVAVDFCHINAEVFGIPFATALTLYGNFRYWTPDLMGFVAYLRDQPVAIATIAITGSTVGFYSVATRPRWQRQGIGELQSTPEGAALYKRIGFTTISPFEIYYRDHV
jgi:ribosomal protein S18 acetylase RimI-like enzyme